mmetsp:Transcript_15121/g.44594  ORF Transcript_15121/g.44594 Transcript_15121/m.44594 type:complete len:145 (-) Transcript_15121:1459-1893(-)
MRLRAEWEAGCGVQQVVCSLRPQLPLSLSHMWISGVDPISGNATRRKPGCCIRIACGNFADSGGMRSSQRWLGAQIRRRWVVAVSNNRQMKPDKAQRCVVHRDLPCVEAKQCGSTHSASHVCGGVAYSWTAKSQEDRLPGIYIG